MEKELQKRKNTRLQGFDYSLPGAYFLTICTQNRKNILSKIVGDEAMGWLKYQATKKINQLKGTAYERQFQRSFHDHIVRNYTDYGEICKYIHENPLRWQFDKFYEKE